MAKVQTNGMTLGFTTASWTADIISYSQDGSTADDVETSDLSTTTSRTFQAGVLIDEGTYTFDLHFDTEEARLATGGSLDTVTITFPLSDPANSTRATEVFTGFINNFSNSGGINELINGSVTIKVSGSVVFTPES